MNYLKAGITGAVMAFFGTTLCGSKAGQGITGSVYLKAKDSITQNFSTLEDKYGVVYHNNKYIFSNFDYIRYYNEQLKNNNYWYENKNWNVVKALGVNALWSIPVSLLGAAFHDYYGRDLTKSINEHFKSDISPYLVNAGVFGVLGTFGMGGNLLLFTQHTLNDFTQPWIYSMSIMEGFMIGATAGLAAYFADEPPQDNQVSELQNEIDSLINE